MLCVCFSFLRLTATSHCLLLLPCSRLRSLHDPLAGGEAGPAGGAVAGGVEGPVRMRYRSSLTEENVAYLNKLDQYSSRPDSTGRSSGALRCHVALLCCVAALRCVAALCCAVMWAGSCARAQWLVVRLPSFVAKRLRLRPVCCRVQAVPGAVRRTWGMQHQASGCSSPGAPS